MVPVSFVCPAASPTCSNLSNSPSIHTLHAVVGCHTTGVAPGVIARSHLHFDEDGGDDVDDGSGYEAPDVVDADDDDDGDDRDHDDSDDEEGYTDGAGGDDCGDDDDEDDGDDDDEDCDDDDEEEEGGRRRRGEEKERRRCKSKNLTTPT